MRHLALTGLLLLSPTFVRADGIPKPVADLERFVGTWKATGTATVGATTAKITATWTCKRVSARAGVGCTLEFAGMPGMPVYAETDLFGFEASTNRYHWYAVTNAGETHDHVGTPVAADEPKLQFVYTGTQDGKPFKEVVDFAFAPDRKAIAIRAETFVAGASTSLLDLAAKR